MSLKEIYKHMPLGKLCSMVTKPYFGALILKMEYLGLEKNFSVLILIEQKQNCTQQYISDTLQIDKVSMVKIIDEFAKKGLVKRIQNPKDRREYFIELTAKGHKILPQIHKGIRELNDVAFKGLTQKERKEFYQTLVKVSDNVKGFPSSHIIVYKTAKRK
ncbi:MAG TPA: MarR family transcriptional regulator [Bacteroidia bacterium]|nr:MarR family transcriptional regulator [Bacteroidia bacterium]